MKKIIPFTAGIISVFGASETRDDKVTLGCTGTSNTSTFSNAKSAEEINAIKEKVAFAVCNLDKYDSKFQEYLSDENIMDVLKNTSNEEEVVSFRRKNPSPRVPNIYINGLKLKKDIVEEFLRGNEYKIKEYMEIKEFKDFVIKECTENLITKICYFNNQVEEQYKIKISLTRNETLNLIKGIDNIPHQRDFELSHISYRLEAIEKILEQDIFKIDKAFNSIFLFKVLQSAALNVKKYVYPKYFAKKFDIDDIVQANELLKKYEGSYKEEMQGEIVGLFLFKLSNSDASEEDLKKQIKEMDSDLINDLISSNYSKFIRNNSQRDILSKVNKKTLILLIENHNFYVFEKDENGKVVYCFEELYKACVKNSFEKEDLVFINQCLSQDSKIEIFTKLIMNSYALSINNDNSHYSDQISEYFDENNVYNCFTLPIIEKISNSIVGDPTKSYILACFIERMLDQGKQEFSTEEENKLARIYADNLLSILNGRCNKNIIENLESNLSFIRSNFSDIKYPFVAFYKDEEFSKFKIYDQSDQDIIKNLRNRLSQEEFEYLSIEEKLRVQVSNYNARNSGPRITIFDNK